MPHGRHTNADHRHRAFVCLRRGNKQTCAVGKGLRRQRGQATIDYMINTRYHFATGIDPRLGLVELAFCSVIGFPTAATPHTWLTLQYQYISQISGGHLIRIDGVKYQVSIHVLSAPRPESTLRIQKQSWQPRAFVSGSSQEKKTWRAAGASSDSTASCCGSPSNAKTQNDVCIRVIYVLYLSKPAHMRA